jgi:hypothetical protein
MAVAKSGIPGRAKKGRPQRKRPRSASPARAGGKSNSQRLPGWKDLAGSNERVRVASRRGSFLESISTTRFALLIVGMAVLFTLYVGHVHATQDMLAEVQQERRENLRLHLKFNRLKGDFDQMVGPSVIYTRAGDLGLVEDPSFGPTIQVGE